MQEYAVGMTAESGKKPGVKDLLSPFRRWLGLYTQKELALILDEAIHRTRHDLRSPATSISGNAQLLERWHNDPEKVQKFAQAVQKGVDQLVNILDTQTEVAPVLVSELIGKIDELRKKDEEGKKLEAEYLTSHSSGDPVRPEARNSSLLQ